jgi:4-hydroxy-tetrahydrodipicolinate reductase
MKIALIGYGKMGKSIEKIAEDRGHQISLICNSENSIDYADFTGIDLAIEFSKPDLAVKHIEFCIENNIPLVVGTTGWNDALPDITQKVEQSHGSLLHASNFSVGVNLFFELNKKLAQLMSGHPEYKASIEETHHLQKLDSPSGTAISIANGILESNEDYVSWVLGEGEKPYINQRQLPVTSYREPDVPGTHQINYDSEIDSLSIKHVAHSRKGFALGAIIGAEWLFDKKGIFTMSDVLNINQ